MKHFLILVIALCSWQSMAQLEHHLALELEPAGELYSVSPSGRYVVVDSQLAPLTVWDMNEKRIVGLFAGHKVNIEGQSFPSAVQAAAIREDGWLLSSSNTTDGIVEGLIAHNLQTGQSHVLVQGENCSAVIAVPEGFISSCSAPFSEVIIGAEMVHWQVSPQGIARATGVAIPLLSAIDFNLNQQKVSTVEAFPMDDFTPVKIYSYPSLSFAAGFRFDGTIPAMLGDGQRTLVLRHEGTTRELYDLFGSEGPVKISNVAYDGYSPMAFGNNLLMSHFNANGAEYSLFSVNNQQYIQSGLEPHFATTLGWHSFATGAILWTGEQSSYYLPILRLWTSAAVATESNISDYDFIFNSPDWQTLSSHDIRQQNESNGYDTLYAVSAEAVARQFLATNDVHVLRQDSQRVILSAEIFVQDDDSISAERYELSLRPFALASGQRVWGLYEVRKQKQCARGDNTSTWTSQACP